MPAFFLPLSAGGIIKGVQIFDDLADTIANPPSGAPLKQAIGNTGQKLCDFIGAAPIIAQNALGPAFPASRLLCKPYWDGEGYDGPEVGDPPYEGGQCADTYQVYATVDGTDINVGGQSPRNLAGPLGGVTRVETVIGSPFPDTTRYQFIFSGPNDGPETTVRASFNPDVSFRNAGIVGGAPDNCGDPPPVEPFKPGQNPPPLPTGFEPGVDFGTDPITGQPFFFVPPIEDPLDPDGPGIDFDPEEPGTYPGPPEANPSGGEEGIGPGAGVGGGAGGTGDDVDFGEPPEGRVWVGAIAHFVAPSSYGNISGTGPGNTVYPRVVGNLSLIFDNVRGQAAQVRSEWFDLMRPSDALPVTGARANKLPGVECTVYPISAPICPEDGTCGLE